MIIETKKEFIELLSEYKEKDAILMPLLSDSKHNALNNELCAIFVKLLNIPELYILPFNHNDCNNLNIGILKSLAPTSNRKYILDKKKYLNFLENFKNLLDINVLYYLNNNKPIEIQENPSNAELFFLQNNQETKNIYNSIPILKLEEKFIKYSSELENVINNNNILSDSDKSFQFLNEKTINNLHLIEKNGIYTNSDTLLHFFPDYDTHIDDKGYIYSEYNIYTSTGRPSNRFGNLNFSALNKDNGEREFIISRFKNDGMIMYFDYEAYHLNLAAEVVDYKFPSDLSIHEYLGRQYFNKSKLTEEEYNQSKSVSFEILYGGIDDSISKVIPFFHAAKIFIDSLWAEYLKNGFIKTNISQKKIYGDNLNSMNSNKLFNYYLQNYETERNILIMDKLNKLLNNYETKLIMYLYDGFLFDYKRDDGKDLFLKIKNIMEEGKYKTKQYVGKNFNNLQKIA